MISAAGVNGQWHGARFWGVAVSVVIGMLGGCATEQASDVTPSAEAPSVVRALVQPLEPPRGTAGEREFTAGSSRGALDAAGNWRLRAEISHPRIRCATYQVGMRFGVGDAACETVDWQTGPTLLPSRTQCNNATLIHSGEGLLDLPSNQIRALNCVRVSVQCSGTCG
jgi:hypothetical protein